MPLNFREILSWAARHATDLPTLVTAVEAVVSADTWLEKVRAAVELSRVLQSIFADFPLPSTDDRLYGIEAPGEIAAKLAAAGITGERQENFMAVLKG